jgi:hypothetical protein
LDGVLIEARDLVNGTSIVQPDRADRIDYFHLELDAHDVILAEGAESESYIDDDNRRMFDNASDYAACYPAAAARPALYCAPRISDGFELEAVRTRLAARGGGGARLLRKTG